MKPLGTLLSATLVFALNVSVSATVLHVPSEYPTIQAGIDAAVEGDTVLVADGTYTGDGNRDLDFGGVNMVVMSENGPEETIIDCEGAGRGFFFHSEEDYTSVLQGFTIKNGHHGYADGGGIRCEHSAPTIRGNTFTQNFVDHFGGAISVAWSCPIIQGNVIVGNIADAGGGVAAGGYGCCPLIIGNIITGNIAREGVDQNGRGGGIICENHSSAIIEGNTVTENTAPHGGGLYCHEASATVTNCIFWDDSPEEIYVASGTVVVSYSDVEGGWPGEGNIDADPMCVKRSWGDYRLRWGSPCVDAGHPDWLDPDGTRSDMGAHFFDQSKTLVTYATPEARTLHQGATYQVLYTLINCHGDPQPARGMVELILPNGEPWPGNPLEGPGYGVMPPEFNWQYVREYEVPATCPLGTWTFTWKVGMPGNLFDKDTFTFSVVGP